MRAYVPIHACEKRQFSDSFLMLVCQWLLSFSQTHHCLLGCDPNSQKGQFIMRQLPHIPLYHTKEVHAEWFIDAFFDESHEHSYATIHAKILSIALPSQDVSGMIRCDQILLDQAHMPQTFNHAYFKHRVISLGEESGEGHLI